MNSINEILVVGGGTSGWLSAAILAKVLNSGHAGDVKVTLVESPDIPTIGVGEGTFPTLVETMVFLGIDEEEFITKCSATFKQAIKFVDWVHPPGQTDNPYYYHLFENPVKSRGIELVPSWLASDRKIPFAQAVSHQAAMCEKNLAPRALNSQAYKWLGRYAYHFDAGKFGKLLRDHCVNKLGVKHLLATVKDVALDEHGFIESVSTKEVGVLKADFFVDCTGFASILLGKTLGVPFNDYSKMLFVDSAVTMRVPYTQPNQDIPSYTIATAQEAGWTWDIGLSDRRGIGYAYSSKHTSHEKADVLLRHYIGAQAEGKNVNRIAMRTGRRELLWKNNCVAIGFSGGFAEPLEATAIVMTEAAALSLAMRFPRHRDAIPAVAEQYNKVYQFRWDQLFDFIKLHYCISKRRDTSFWVDNVNPESISENLLHLLELWKHYPPVGTDIPNINDMFREANYQYILYGMDYPTDVSNNVYVQKQSQQAKLLFKHIQEQSEKIVKQLPSHRSLISAIHSRNQ